MLYEIIATVRPHSIAEVKDIARSAGNLILQNGGVVRGITNWGISALPKPLRNKSGSSLPSSTAAQDTSPYAAQLGNKHTVGHYFIMRFDSSSKTQHMLRKTWASDPRLLRFSVVKMGTKFEEIASVPGKDETFAHAEGHEGSTGIDFAEDRQYSAVSDAVKQISSSSMSMSGGKYRFTDMR